MPINVKKGSVNTQTYTVKGNSLADIWAMIQRKGPRDPNANRRYAGICSCSAELARSSTKLDFQVEKKGNKTYATTWMKAGRLGYDCNIKVPKLANNRSLSQAAKREWDRFLSATNVHENGHVKSYGKEVKKIAQDIEAIKATAHGANENAAKRAAISSYSKLLNKISIKDRLNADARKYDKKTNHGATQGATLDTSIQ